MEKIEIFLPQPGKTNLKFCRKNGTSRITMGLVPFSLCGDMGYLSGLDINISELAGFLRGNGISSLS